MERQSQECFRFVSWLLAAGAILTTPSNVHPAVDVIEPVVEGGVRFIGGEFFLVGFTFVSVSPNLEDRTILEFELPSFLSPLDHAILFTGLRDFSPGGLVDTLDFYAYEGDTVLAVSDWDAGVLAMSCSYDDVYADVWIDITDIVQDATDSGFAILGIRLSTVDGDYVLGGGFADPVLVIQSALDQEDYAEFSVCMNGPDGEGLGLCDAVAPCDALYDFDGDDDVDLADYAIIQSRFAPQ